MCNSNWIYSGFFLMRVWKFFSNLSLLIIHNYFRLWCLHYSNLIKNKQKRRTQDGTLRQASLYWNLKRKLDQKLNLIKELFDIVKIYFINIILSCFYFYRNLNLKISIFILKVNTICALCLYLQMHATKYIPFMLREGVLISLNDEIKAFAYDFVYEMDLNCTYLYILSTTFVHELYLDCTCRLQSPCMIDIWNKFNILLSNIPRSLFQLNIEQKKNQNKTHLN